MKNKISNNKYDLIFKNVNDQILFEEIKNFLNDVVFNFSSMLYDDIQRDMIIEIVNEYMEDLKSSNKIIQWDVICDARNNTRQMEKEGKLNFFVHYKQKNCFNITKLELYLKNEN